MRAVQTLEEAWALIQQPGKWTQNAIARDANGRTVGSTNPDAVCFCSLGAINKTGYHLEQFYGLEEATRWLRTASDKLYGNSNVAEVNDKAANLQSIAPMWELAIQLAKENHEQEANS